MSEFTELVAVSDAFFMIRLVNITKTRRRMAGDSRITFENCAGVIYITREQKFLGQIFTHFEFPFSTYLSMVVSVMTLIDTSAAKFGLIPAERCGYFLCQRNYAICTC